MSGMRWADSDSDSEEEYVPPSQHSPQQIFRSPSVEDSEDGTESKPDAKISTAGSWSTTSSGGRGRGKRSPERGHGGARSPDRSRGGGGRGRGGGRQQQQRQDKHHHQGGRGLGGRGGGRGGGKGGKTGGRQDHQNSNRGSDWRQMAKASSRFGGETSAQNEPVDGSAWMANRRAKRELEEKEFKAKQMQEKQQAEQDKRERRKSQLDALKAAMSQIKDAEPPSSTTSLQRAAASGEPLPSGNKQPPVQILSRDNTKAGKEANNVSQTHKINNSQRNDQKKHPNGNKKADFFRGNSPKLAQSNDVQQYNITISGPPPTSVPVTQKKPPRGELQADGSVKFSRQGNKGPAIKNGSRGVKSPSKSEQKKLDHNKSGLVIETSSGELHQDDISEVDDGDDLASQATGGAAEDDASITSRGSRANNINAGNKKRRNNRRGPRGGRNSGRGKRVDATGSNDDRSVGSNRSRSAGGRGGRGSNRGGAGGQGSRGLEEGRGGGRNRGSGRGQEGNSGGGRSGRGGGGGNDNKHKGNTAKGKGRGGKGKGKSNNHPPQHSYEIGKV